MKRKKGQTFLSQRLAKTVEEMEIKKKAEPLLRNRNFLRKQTVPNWVVAPLLWRYGHGFVSGGVHLQVIL